MELDSIVLTVSSFVAGSSIPLLFYHLHTKPKWAALLNEQKAACAASASRLEVQGQMLEQLKQSAQQYEADMRGAEAAAAALSTKLAVSETRGERLIELEEQLEAKQSEIGILAEKHAGANAKCAELSAILEAERQAMRDKLLLLEEAQKKLSDAFNAVSAEALTRNNQAFLDLAKATLEKYQQGAAHDLDLRHKSIEESMKPIQDSLRAVDGKLQELEVSRMTAYTSLTEQVKGLMSSQVGLQQETQKLVKALRTPSVGGRWGELQLRNVVEMAGMLEYCDFFEQTTLINDDQRLRPDMIVKLPNDRSIVVDSKAPLQAFLDAAQCNDEEERQAHLANFAANVRSHLNKLGAKSYWEQLDYTPDFVIMFLPGEHLFSAALTVDPQLIQLGVESKVMIATPTSLITLLRSTAYGWKQEKLAQNAHAISSIGRELYDRIRTFTSHMVSMGANLGKTVAAYNSAVGSLESRVLVSARKFDELGASDGKQINIVETCEQSVRQISTTPVQARVLMIGTTKDSQDVIANE